MYEIKKEGGQWIVRTVGTHITQFRSLRRKNCTDWLEANTK